MPKWQRVKLLLSSTINFTIFSRPSFPKCDHGVSQFCINTTQNSNTFKAKGGNPAQPTTPIKGIKFDPDGTVSIPDGNGGTKTVSVADANIQKLSELDANGAPVAGSEYQNCITAFLYHVVAIILRPIYSNV